jgi:hypothetical protein
MIMSSDVGVDGYVIYGERDVYEAICDLPMSTLTSAIVTTVIN